MQSMTSNQAATTQQTAIQRAILSANDKVSNIKTPVTNAPSKDLQAVIGRHTVLGEKILFIVDTHVKHADGSERISYWTQGSNHLRDAPIEFYRQSKPLGKDDVIPMTTAYCKQMKVQNLEVRQRLVKEQVAKREEDGSISLEAQNEWKETMKAKFKLAFDKAVDQAFASM